MYNFELAYAKPETVVLDSEELLTDIAVKRETITYRPEFDMILDEIKDQYYSLMKERYKPKKLILGVETYKQFISSLSHKAGSLMKVDTFMGMEIVLKQGYAITVVCSLNDELNKSVWGK
jgi:hypothetical protein